MKITTFLTLVVLLFSSPASAEEAMEEFVQPYAAVIPEQSIADAENYARGAFHISSENLAVFTVSGGGDVFLIAPIPAHMRLVKKVF
jgi:hypothetical protein